MTDYHWEIKDFEQDKVVALQKVLGVHKTICQLLVQRGIETFEDSKSFFRMSLKQLHNPFQMKGMEKAILRIEKAIEQNQRILIYGDYDVDGTTSVALLYSFFNEFYKNIDFYIPDRNNEGYGISFLGIDYAEEHKCELIIALDCGIKAIDKVAYANKKNIDFIICDHHTPGEEIPEALAILNPKQKDCPYPYKELSGCGIGFKLCEAYAKKNHIKQDQLFNYLDFVAISIACDIVPITGENRILARFGLEHLNKNPNKGVKHIVDILNFDKSLSISDLVFKIGPRINAAGRVSHAKEAVSVLIGSTPSTILQTNNEDRQKLDLETTLSALELLKAPEYQNRLSTVVYRPEWHKGVIGIVASRLIENYYKPTIVFTKSKGLLVASARSVKGFNIYKAIEACSEYLVNFGGHFYAAGLSIYEKDFEAFSNRFEQVVKQSITEKQKTPALEIDGELNFTQINDSFMKLLKQFAPFGPQNRKPVFLTKSLKNGGYSKAVGKQNAHLKLHLKDSENHTMNGIAFNMGDRLDLVLHESVDICYTIEENHWNNKCTLQLMIKDIKKNKN